MHPGKVRVVLRFSEFKARLRTLSHLRATKSQWSLRCTQAKRSEGEYDSNSVLQTCRRSAFSEICAGHRGELDRVGGGGGLGERVCIE